MSKDQNLSLTDRILAKNPELNSSNAQSYFDATIQLGTLLLRTLILLSGGALVALPLYVEHVTSIKDGIPVFGVFGFGVSLVLASSAMYIAYRNLHWSWRVAEGIRAINTSVSKKNHTIELEKNVESENNLRSRTFLMIQIFSLASIASFALGAISIGMAVVSE